MDKKLKEELKFWINDWNNALIKKGYFNDDTIELLKKNGKNFDPKEGQENEAFAQLFRIEKEFELNKDYFNNKKILEIGCGAVQFLEVCSSKLSVGIEPLSNEFKKRKMLNNFSESTLYLNCFAENIPLVDNFFDVIISRNCLDHTNFPKKVINECSRVLKKTGIIFLGTDIGHLPTKKEPLSLNKKEIISWLKESGIKITFKKTDSHTYNFKKGKRLILKGIKNG